MIFLSFTRPRADRAAFWWRWVALSLIVGKFFPTLTKTVAFVVPRFNFVGVITP
jgi:hypothetical protein